jgi:large subunit ribosomal protein L17
MRHNKAGRRLGRTTSHRTAMFRNMVTSFLEHERITTTDAKAKELRPIAEKLITLGKKGDLNAIRQAASFIRDKKVVTKLFSVIAPRYKEREGGYTRIIKIGQRFGDASPQSVIELVEEEIKKKEVKKKTKSEVAVKTKQPKPKVKAVADSEETNKVAVSETVGEESSSSEKKELETTAEIVE